jgi:hypothetical protein
MTVNRHRRLFEIACAAGIILLSGFVGWLMHARHAAHWTDSLRWFPIIALVVVMGALGGAINALISDNGFFLPMEETKSGTRIWRPGFLGNMVIGSTAAFVSWGLYGPLSSSLVYPLRRPGGLPNSELQYIEAVNAAHLANEAALKAHQELELAKAHLRTAEDSLRATTGTKAKSLELENLVKRGYEMVQVANERGEIAIRSIAEAKALTDAAQKVLDANAKEALMQSAGGLSLSGLVGAVLVGVGGARWLTNEVDKRLLRLAGSKAAAKQGSSEKDSLALMTLAPADALESVMREEEK